MFCFTLIFWDKQIYCIQAFLVKKDAVHLRIQLIDLRVSASLHWLLKMKLLPTLVCSTHYWKSKLLSHLQIMRKTDWSLFLIRNLTVCFRKRKKMEGMFLTSFCSFCLLWGQKKTSLQSIILLNYFEGKKENRLEKT